MDGIDDNDDGAKSDDKEAHAEALERYKQGIDADDHNRKTYAEDVRFARLGQQWPTEIERKRNDKFRPCLTFNRMPTFIRQVVNDARLNKPEIKVYPCDSNADPDTAEILRGMIRNIQISSGAEAAYDTALDCAASGGFGYFRINIVPSRNDVFENDITIERIVNPLAVVGDHTSTAADSSDWNYCFVLEYYTEDQFEDEWPDAQPVSFEADDADHLGDWKDDENVLVAEYWTREEVTETVYKMQTGEVVSEDALGEYAQYGIWPVATRDVASYRVTQHIMSGAEILEVNAWPGDYIPIVKVCGEEVYVDGKRYLRSMIHDAMDAQRAFNYWRTSAIEKVALDAKAPVMGPKGAFKSDAQKWAALSTENHSYLEYDGPTPPQRLISGGVPAGDLQMAAMANDDLKGIIGLYDASLGARSNETSGVAIQARDRQGDISTFHFIDNLSRSIKHCGRILVDLIPHVFTGERIVRVIGEDGSAQTVPINRQFQDATGALRIYDISAGKYDVTVSVGPSFSTRRQEAAMQMTEFVRAFPPMMQFGGDLLVKNLDWPGAEELAERLRMQNPLANGQAQAQQQGGQPQPQMAQMQQMAQRMQMQFQAQAQQMQQQLQQAYQRMQAQQHQIMQLQLALKDKHERNLIEQQRVNIQAAQMQARVASDMARAQQPNQFNPMMR